MNQVAIDNQNDTGALYCNCLEMRNVYNQIQAGTFFYTKDQFPKYVLENYQQKVIPEIVIDNCNSCKK